MQVQALSSSQEPPLARPASRAPRSPGTALPAAPSRAVARTALAVRPPLWLVPPAVTLAVMLWGIRGASYARDEAATLSAAQRPFRALLYLLGNVDAVHGPYYVLLWPVVRLAGTGELATRLPSALAMTAAAAAICGLGRRLVSSRAGLAAGLAFAILPQVSKYGQTARPYAMAVALAAIASYLLVRAIQDAAAGQDVRGWLMAYAACLTALGYLHFFGLLLVAAHAVPVTRAWLGEAGDRTGGALPLGWLAAVGGAVTLASPVVALGMRQRGASLSWEKPGSLTGLASLIGPVPMAEAAGLVVLCAVAVSAIAGPARLRAAWPGDLIALCVPWLIVPPFLLIAASSLITPMYVFRYILFCVPAAALLLGAGLAALGRKAGTAALAVLVMLALPQLLQLRTAGGHSDDIRAADRIVARNRRPGDALMYFTLSEPVGMAYPYGFRQLRNVVQGQAAAPSGTLGGTWAPLRAVRLRTELARRIWLVQLSSGAHPRSPAGPPGILARLGYRKARAWHFAGIWLSLYVPRKSAVALACQQLSESRLCYRNVISSRPAPPGRPASHQCGFAYPAREQT